MRAPSWLDRKHFPFHSHYFNAAAGKIHYVDEGQGDPVVMVHGNPTWSFAYRHLIRELRKSRRCIALDHLGFGLSDKPAGWSYRPADHAVNLRALIESLRLERITLVLQDWGGPLGMAYAVAHPEKISGLVLMNTWAWPVQKHLHFKCFSMLMGGAVGRHLVQRYNFFADTLLPMVCQNKLPLDATVRDHYTRPFSNPEERTGCLVFPREIVGSTDWLDQIWRQHQVLLGKPKLLLWGMKDIAFRKQELERWQTAYPEAAVIRLPSVGHLPQEEAPDEVAYAIKSFLPGG